MRYQSPRHSCGCRSVGECQHYNGPTLDEDRAVLERLVSAFSGAMAAKLHAKAKVRGGWDDEEWTVDDIKRALVEHIDRGDPVDVANFCAFWWNRLGDDWLLGPISRMEAIEQGLITAASSPRAPCDPATADEANKMERSIARLRGLLAECLTPLRGYEMEADFEESQSTASLIARIDAALSGGGKEAK